MSVAFSVEVARSRCESRWRAAMLSVPALGLALSAAQLASGPTLLVDGTPLQSAAATFACALGAAGFALAALRASVGGRRSTAVSADGARAAIHPTLVVDDTGHPALKPLDDIEPRPMALRAWCILPGLTILVLAPYRSEPSPRGGARPVTLVLGRDAMPDETWRRLHVWLRWNDRGRTDRPTLGPHRP